MPYATVDDLTLYYEEHGAGARGQPVPVASTAPAQAQRSAGRACRYASVVATEV